MEVGIIFKIALVGILVSMLNQILRQSGREEQAFLTGLAGIDPRAFLGHTLYRRTV